MSRIKELELEIRDLKRSVRDLYLRVPGGGPPEDHDDYLLHVYVSAHRSIGTHDTIPDLWLQLLRNLTARQLLHLAREFQDPFPWRSFLLVIERLRKQGQPVESAHKHLLQIITDLLTAQGMGVLSPEDVMGNDPAGSTISR